jgi:hypothetical protein
MIVNFFYEGETLMANMKSDLSTSSKTSPRLRGLTAVTLFILAVQFLLGMEVNLFVTIPTNHPGANPPEYFSGVFNSVAWAVTSSSSPFWLLLHASMGLVLAVLTIALLISAIVSRKGSWIAIAIVGLIGVVGAGFNGGSFLNYNEDISSMLMSLGFILAIMTYSIGLARGK